MWSSGIMAAIAEASGLDVVQDMFRLMIMFGWVGYFFVFLMVILSLIDGVKLYRWKKDVERFGDDNG